MNPLHQDVSGLSEAVILANGNLVITEIIRREISVNIEAGYFGVCGEDYIFSIVMITTFVEPCLAISADARAVIYEDV